MRCDADGWTQAVTLMTELTESHRYDADAWPHDIAETSYDTDARSHIRVAGGIALARELMELQRPDTDARRTPESGRRYGSQHPTTVPVMATNKESTGTPTRSRCISSEIEQRTRAAFVRHRRRFVSSLSPLPTWILLIDCGYDA